MSERISCEESDNLRRRLSPWSSCTNFIDGSVLNDDLPPHTRCEWCDDDEVVRLIDTLDADGCRHEVPDRSRGGRRCGEHCFDSLEQEMRRMTHYRQPSPGGGDRR